MGRGGGGAQRPPADISEGVQVLRRVNEAFSVAFSLECLVPRRRHLSVHYKSQRESDREYEREREREREERGSEGAMGEGREREGGREEGTTKPQKPWVKHSRAR